MPASNDVIRANKKYEGQYCAICKREISLGEFIHICPKCQSINHEECWQNEGGCNSLSCNSLSSQSNFNNGYQGGGYQGGGYQQNSNNSFQQPPNNSFPRTPGAGARPNNSFGNNRNMNAPMGGSMSGGMPANMVPCRFCKEPIMRGARKCKHCGEYQNEADRQQANTSMEVDTNLSVTDWIGILCCPIIGIIQSGIYFVQEKTEKGKKLLVGCVISMIIGFILRASAPSR